MIYGLGRSGVTVFVTTHYLDEAEHASRVAIMHDGVLRALDSPAQRRNRSDRIQPTLEDVFVNLICQPSGPDNAVT